MPKPTFFRLNEEKQARLIQAAHDEFSRVPFESASISNIIRLAGIPRGSFYQYFEDKADIYFYLLQQLRVTSQQHLNDALQASKGDFFQAMAQNFGEVIDDIVEGHNAALYRNVFMYMDYRGAARLSPAMFDRSRDHDAHEAQVRRLYDKVDTDKLQIDDIRDFKMLMGLVMNTFMQTIGHYYAHQSRGEEVSIDELKQRLHQLLHWIQSGVGK
ncbi:TetR family transcriptional regulator [Lacticaseibacillus saniviri]